MPKKKPHAKEDPKVSREETRTIRTLAQRMRKEIVTDLAELEWDDTRDLNAMQRLASVLDGLLQIETLAVESFTSTGE